MRSVIMRALVQLVCVAATIFAQTETMLHAAAFADKLKIAENVLLYQRATGGWPKNYDREQDLTETQRVDVLNDK